MKIVIATPLYPPDIAQPAPYVKTLASKLVEQHHQITVVLYGKLPEEVLHVRYVCTDKSALLLIRLVRVVLKLIREAQHADLLFIENGASTELPVIVALFFIRSPIIFHIGDIPAHTRTSKQHFLKYVEKLLRRRAYKTITEIPLQRPEILPFAPYPQEAFTAYDASWQKHMELLNVTFDHARQ